MATGRVFGRSEGRVTIAKLWGTEVVIRTTDADEIVEYLEEVRNRIEDMQAVFDEFGEYMVEQHIPAQFERKGTPKRWAPLSPAYAKWKQEHYPGRPLLVLSGRMRKMFNYRAGSRSLRIDNRRKEYGVRLFDVHQFGAGRIPARPMIQITEVDRDVFHEMVADHIEGAERELQQ